MLNQKTLWGCLVGLLLFANTSSTALGEIPHSLTQQTSQFHSIEQPLVLKIAVTIGGLALIGIELWWFIFSKSVIEKSELRNQK
jgi:plastocyanin domain-containing protein